MISNFKEPIIPVSLKEKLQIEEKEEKIGITEDRLKANIEKIRGIVSFFRQYPDLLLDMLTDPNEKFKFYFYQRFFLRCAMRHRYMYATFPRAYSKSFLSIMALYVRCMLYPNSKLFIVSGGKEQSAKIAQEKIEELWKFFPALRNEIIYERGNPKSSTFQRDYIKLVFKNGSYLDIVGARQTSRGGRRTSGLIEECAQVDGQILSEVIIPMMNVSRRAAFGAEDLEDITNKAQLYITTAGDKGTYAYDKLVQIFLWSIMRPNESICIGGSWRVPVACGLLSKTFVNDLKEDGTYSEATFSREYESRWGGGNDKSFFDSTEFDKCRILEEAMWEAPLKKKRGSKIIFSYDVGRLSDNSSLIVLFLEPTDNGTYIKKVVNIFNFQKMHFSEQAFTIKKLYYTFQAEKIVLDANGLGVGLLDFLTIPTINPKNGEVLPAFGVDKDFDPKGDYKKWYNVSNGQNNAIALIKANQGLNSELHTLCAAQIASNKVQFLIDDQYAEEKFKRRMVWKTYSTEKKIEVLRPYKLTKILKEEMMNLRQKEEGGKVTLKKIASGMKKDKFSAFEYGLWYARKLELKNKGTKMNNKMSLVTVGRSGFNRNNSSVRDRFGSGRGGAWRRG